MGGAILVGSMEVGLTHPVLGAKGTDIVNMAALVACDVKG
jgi:phosphotransacetylase